MKLIDKHIDADIICIMCKRNNLYCYHTYQDSEICLKCVNEVRKILNSSAPQSTNMQRKMHQGMYLPAKMKQRTFCVIL